MSPGYMAPPPGQANGFQMPASAPPPTVSGSAGMPTSGAPPMFTPQMYPGNASVQTTGGIDGSNTDAQAPETDQ